MLPFALKHFADVSENQSKWQQIFESLSNSIYYDDFIIMFEIDKAKVISQ